MFLLISTISQVQKTGVNVEPRTVNCQLNATVASAEKNATLKAFTDALRDVTNYIFT